MHGLSQFLNAVLVLWEKLFAGGFLAEFWGVEVGVVFFDVTKKLNRKCIVIVEGRVEELLEPVDFFGLQGQ